MKNIINKIRLKFTSNRRMIKISKKLISSILTLNYNSKDIQLLVIDIDNIMNVNDVRYVNIICQDLTGSKYSVLIDYNSLLSILRKNNIFKYINHDDVFIKKL